MAATQNMTFKKLHYSSLNRTRLGSNIKAAGIATIFAMISNDGLAADTFPTQIDRLSFQWQQLEKQHSHMEAQWLKRQTILEQQANLLDIETRKLTKIINKDQQSTNEVEQKRTALLQQQIQAEQDQQNLETVLENHLNSVLDLQYRLPPPLQLQWQATLDTASNSNETSVNSKKLALILQLLTQLEDFENRIALNQTIMTIEGVDVQVQQIYLGLSQGWYVDKHGRYAGYGRSTKEGWQWQIQTNPTDTKALLKTVAILNNETAAAFVSLPINLATNVNAGTTQ